MITKKKIIQERKETSNRCKEEKVRNRSNLNMFGSDVWGITGGNFVDDMEETIAVTGLRWCPFLLRRRQRWLPNREWRRRIHVWRIASLLLRLRCGERKSSWSWIRWVFVRPHCWLSTCEFNSLIINCCKNRVLEGSRRWGFSDR